MKRITGHRKTSSERINTPGQQNVEPESSDSNPEQENTKFQVSTGTGTHPDPASVQTIDSHKKCHKPFEWWKSRVEFAGIFFAIGYAIITYLQWHDARINFTVDQRAWISVTKIGVTLDLGKPLAFKVHELNTGKTPARNVLGRIVGEAVKAGEHPAFDISRIDTTRGYLPPNGEYTGDIDLTRKLPHGLDQQGLAEMIKGDWTPYIGGLIEYDDIFKGHHLRV